MHSEKEGLQLITNLKESRTKVEETLDHFLLSEVLNTRTNYIYYTIINLKEMVIGYIDLTGWFLKKLSYSNEYIIVAYYFDTNHIRVLLIKNH